MNLFRTVVRLRGNDAVSCGEGFFVAHEPLCFNGTGDWLRGFSLHHTVARCWIPACGPSPQPHHPHDQKDFLG